MRCRETHFVHLATWLGPHLSCEFTFIDAPLLMQVYDSMDSLGGREASAILTALAWQDHRPHSMWMRRLLATLLPQLPLLSGRSLAMLLHSLARLGHRPGGSWMQACADASGARLQQLNAKDAASIVWAFAVLDFEMPSGLADACASLLLQPSEGGPADIAEGWQPEDCSKAPEEGIRLRGGQPPLLLAELLQTLDLLSLGEKRNRSRDVVKQ